MNAGSVVQGLGRRQFCWGVAGAATLLVAGMGSAGAAPVADVIEVFTLDADWGYPRGPHAKTRLISAASRRAAVNRIALSPDEALAMNLHLCSCAPTQSLLVNRSAFGELWADHSYVWHNPWLDRDVRILDLRRVLAAPDGRERWAAAKWTPPTPGDEWSNPDPSAAPRPVVESVTVAAAATPQTGASGLPVTGVQSWPAGLGAGLVAAGAALTVLSRRKNEAARTAAERP
jgi:LPXTG-motif cell wall-anchored protein